jgi:hypothetical protein
MPASVEVCSNMSQHLRLSEVSRLFRIEVDDDAADSEFPGWIPVADEGSHLMLVRGIRYSFHCFSDFNRSELKKSFWVSNDSSQFSKSISLRPV